MYIHSKLSLKSGELTNMKKMLYSLLQLRFLLYLIASQSVFDDKVTLMLLYR